MGGDRGGGSNRRIVVTRQRRSPLSSVMTGLGIMVLMAGTGALGFFLGIHYKPAQTQRPIPQILPVAAPAPAVNSVEQPQTPPTLLTAGTDAVPIIMYHDVLPRKEVWFDLTTPEFAQQMDDLDQAGAHPITFQELYDHLLSNQPLPSHPILLTFDDCTLGQFTDALPILKRHHFPAVFFVQTASVGVTTEKQHMTWEQLKQAEATGLITVESHTVTHPEDITTLSSDQLDTEFQTSKQTLEEHLGHPVRFLAYPSGNCDFSVEQAAIRAGYLAAVTMDRGWAASPAQSYFLPRFTPKRLPEVIDTWTNAALMQPPLPRLIQVKNTPLERGTFADGGMTVEWIAGGDLGTESLDTRKTVGEMAQEANAQAALNGTFFADARVESTGNAMIGPVLCRVNSAYAPAVSSEDTRTEGRPLILMGEGKCLILPYAAHLGHSQDVLQSLMPDVKDAFLAGGWIVHDGKAVTPEVMQAYSTADYNDPRHRAFVGIDGQGRYLLGATQDSVSTATLAQMLEKMQVQEAWLMDSGFSTSLIWENHVLVSGHFHKDVPSRPVPHALFLFGDPAPDAQPAPPDTPLAAGDGAATTADALAADSGAGAAHYVRRHHRKHHRTNTTT